MTLTWNHRLVRSPEDGTGAGEAPGTPAPANPAATPAPTAPDYSWMPAPYVKDGQPDFASFSAHYTELAADAARRAEVPGAPEAYTYALPEGMTFEGLPPDMSIRIAADDPALAPLFEELGAFAKGLNLPQEAVTGMMGLLGKYEASRAASAYAAQQADVATLAPTPAAREARIAAVADKIAKAIPDARQAAALKAAVQTADGVRALETLFSRGLGPTSPAPQPAGAHLAGLTGKRLLDAVFTS